MSDKQIDSKI